MDKVTLCFSDVLQSAPLPRNFVLQPSCGLCERSPKYDNVILTKGFYIVATHYICRTLNSEVAVGWQSSLGRLNMECM